MNRVSLSLTVLVAALAAAWAGPLAAEDSCCRCGSGCGVRKMCRLVCEEIEIKDYCYGCECDHFCIPGPSCRGCKHCDGCCGEAEECNCCDHRPCCCLEWFDWCPGCAKVKCVRKLTKYEITRMVPGYKWVVEDVCPSCCEDAGCYQPWDEHGNPAPVNEVPGMGDEAPAPPPVAAPQAASQRGPQNVRGYSQQ